MMVGLLVFPSFGAKRLGPRGVAGGAGERYSGPLVAVALNLPVPNRVINAPVGSTPRPIVG
jgi:hypothetical protein